MKTTRSNAWLRARADYILRSVVALKHRLKEEEDRAADMEIRYLQSGVVRKVESLGLAGEAGIDELLAEGSYSDEPLTQVEWQSLDTWYAAHPERIAGTVKTTTSRSFPVTIKGARADVEETIERILSEPSPDTQPNSQAPNKMEATTLDTNKKKTEARIAKASRKPAPKGKVLSFDEVVKRYNSGLERGAIEAWVWYKRTLGVPMTGWEKYFLPEGGQREEFYQATREVVIHDTTFRPLYTAKKEQLLGRPIAGELPNKPPGSDFVGFRDGENVKAVTLSAVTKQSGPFTTDPAALHSLVMEGHLFFRNGELVPKPLFTFGNIYEHESQLLKDQDAINEAYGAEVFTQHRQILTESKPAALSIIDPDTRQRPVISAHSVFSKLFEVEELREDTGLVFDGKLTLLEAFEAWLSTVEDEEIQGATTSQVIKHFVKQKSVAYRDMSKPAKESLKQAVRNEGERLFTKFLTEAITHSDQIKLDLDWNSRYNGTASISYTQVPVGFRASAKFKGFTLDIRPPQREGIAYMDMVGSGIIAYDVGVGKTMTSIVTLANALQNGQCKRPLIVVPDPTYQKWIWELVGYEKDGKFVEGVLSHTGVTINDWYNLNNDILSKIDADKPVPENSITIVTYHGLMKIGYSLDEEGQMFKELSDLLMQGDEDGKRDSAVMQSKYEEAVGLGSKDTVVDIDKLGFDFMVIDEAHRCNHIFDMVRAQEGQRSFNTTGSTSARGLKAFFLCNYIQRRYGGNVMLLTATPFNNSPLEIFSMLSLLALNTMRAQGIANINVFFDLFVHEEEELVVNDREQIVPKTVIKRFNNRLLMQRLLHNHILYKTGEEAGVKRPCKIVLPRLNEKKGGRIMRLPPDQQRLTYLKMTEKQRSLQNQITEMAQNAQPDDSGTILRAMGASLDNALSPYLVKMGGQYVYETRDYKELVSESPKLNYALRCIKEVKEWHEQRGETPSGQVLYMNRGKEIIPMVKEWLIKEAGFKERVKYGRRTLSEVEVIAGGISGDKKEAIKEAFNDGIVKVIIGTATIREGIELQKRGTVLHNCYLDWNPTDLVQLEGRIHRQGNQFAYVRVNIPLVQDSMDVFIFQKLEEKTARTNDLWYRGDRGNVIELDAMDPAEVKMALLTNVEAMARMIQGEEKAKKAYTLETLKYEVKTLSEITQLQNTLNYQRERLVSNINDYAGRILDLMEEKEKPTSGQQKINETLQAFVRGPKADEDIDATMKVLRRYRDFNYLRDYDFLPWRKTKGQYLKGMKKVPNGMTVDQARAERVEEYNKAKAELDFIQSDRRLKELISQAKEAKEKLQIDGKSISERVKEFASLNYLLAFKYGANHPNGCGLPSVEEIPGTRDDAKLTREQKVKKMKMQKLKLKLLQTKIAA
ncbi:MAG TPA: SNF2 family helicase [Cytophagales bacterium]|nr:SNF2 family helicase [Cytophagales bacterium]